jgi:hypothetical protein
MNLNPNLDTESVIVVGNGNVAIDIIRVLSKTSEEMSESDIPEYALNSINKSPIKNLYIVGRRGPVQAKFTNVELRELGNLKNCTPNINHADLASKVQGDNSTCQYSSYINFGCTYEGAINFDDSANVDDGLCEYMIGDINSDGILNILDLVQLVNLVLD